MEIGICTDRNDFFYDIHSLVKSFFPDDDVSIFCDEDREKCERSRNLLIRVEIPEYGTGRKEARDTIAKYILFYNRVRIHQSLGYLTPVEFENLFAA